MRRPASARRPRAPLAALCAALAALSSCGTGAAPATPPAPATRPAPASPTTPKPATPATPPAPGVTRKDTAAAEPEPGETPERVAPPAVAYQRGWMPLEPTGVPAFLRAHPQWDGRGVLIGILDSGIDPSIAGFGTTSAGTPKLLDARDFSGEGRIALHRLTPRGDTLDVDGHRLLGASRVAALAGTGPLYGGTLREIALGNAPAADLNGDGAASDTLPLVVARASDGWVLFVDADGNGSLANDRPVHDYLRARETFGWAVPGRPSPLTLAANLADGATAGAPALDLFFDTSGHGSHVAGIAAGHDIYGVRGFDGVAPGAQLIGLKIADDAQGGVTTTGSMLHAMDYAIRFAAARKLPLVLNMSFGVGNEVAGQARIDAMVDSVLAAHPDVVFAISAGNDGPGLSTIGFPASASRPISVGALFPAAIVAASGGTGAVDAPASFSARGGELAKPDLITPGIAYSTVPRWDTGKEIETGTSMASPHAAGLAALLVSALRQSSQPVEAASIKQALMVTAQPLAGSTYLDQGTGVPDVGRAWQWLGGHHAVSQVRVRALSAGATAELTIGPGARDTVRRFELTPASGASGSYTLRSDVPWLSTARSVTLGGGPAVVALGVRPESPRTSGVRVGVVTGWPADTLAGPAFRLVVTDVVPEPAVGDLALRTGTVPVAGVARFFIPADSARPFDVRVESGIAQASLAYLHEPGGRPYREDPGRAAGNGDNAAVFHIDARDAVSGDYEVDVVAPPSKATSATVAVQRSPVRIGVSPGSAAVTLTNVTALPATITSALLLVGIERTERIAPKNTEPYHIPVSIPAWVKSVTVDVAMDPAQWARFTDFGVTLFDAAGRQIAQEPMNYALGRLSADLPADHGAIEAELGLFPGLADPAGDQSWRATVSVRLYADSAVHAMEPAAPAAIAPGRQSTIRLTSPSLPWAAAPGFAPLAAFIVQAGDALFTREFTLPGATAPQ